MKRAMFREKKKRKACPHQFWPTIKGLIELFWLEENGQNERKNYNEAE